LVDRLHFRWDQVHEMAEELEHISSRELINRLEKFMDFPNYDPHGDPIPDDQGNLNRNNAKPVSALLKNENGVICWVKDHSETFLQYLAEQGLTLGTLIHVHQIIAYDQGMILDVSGNRILISHLVASNLWIK